MTVLAAGTIVLVVLVILGLVLIIPLWENGDLQEQKTIALEFVGEDSVFHNGFRQRFDFYHGYMHRSIQFRESRRYTLQLHTSLTSGSIRVQVQNKRKRTLLTLTPESPTGILNVWAEQEYHLTIQFIKAAGEYELTWM